MNRATKDTRESRAEVFDPSGPQLGLHVSFEDDASWFDRGPDVLRLVFCAKPAGKVAGSEPSRQGLVHLHHRRPHLHGLVVRDVQRDSVVHRFILAHPKRREVLAGRLPGLDAVGVRSGAVGRKQSPVRVYV